MLTDSFYEIGTSHEICEDFAIHGPNYAIVSDGCSNGGKSCGTDWGSRLISKAAERHINTLPILSPEQFLDKTTKEAQRLLEPFYDLGGESLTATLLLARRGETHCHTLVVGDGVVGCRKRDGTWMVMRFESGCPNKPFYLRYDMINGGRKRYLEECTREVKIEIYSGKLFDNDEDLTRIEKIEEISENKIHVFHSFANDDVDLIFTATDGLSSFYREVKEDARRYNQPVHFMEVIKVLFDVQQYHSGFLRNQRHWLWKRPNRGTFLERGWKNGDDVAVSAIYLPD